MLFLTLTSNNIKWDAHMMSTSDQLSSSIDSSLSHLQFQQVSTVSLFQPSWVYKQAVLDQIHSVSPLLLLRQHLLLYKYSPHHYLLLLDISCLDEKACSWGSSLVPANKPQVSASQVRLPCSQRACKEAAGRNIASLFCSSFHHNFRCFRLPASMWCSFLLLRAWTAIWYHTSSRDWTPLCHKSLLLQAHSCYLVPL